MQLPHLGGLSAAHKAHSFRDGYISLAHSPADTPRGAQSSSRASAAREDIAILLADELDSSSSGGTDAANGGEDDGGEKKEKSWFDRYSLTNILTYIRTYLLTYKPNMCARCCYPG